MDRQSKLEVLSSAQTLGVTETCRLYQISRTTYYKWYKRYTQNGIHGLDEITREYIPRHKTSIHLESLILEDVKRTPQLGPRELKYQLEKKGYFISESAVYNVLRRHGLSTKIARMSFQKKRQKKRPALQVNFSHFSSGAYWLFWITSYGTFDSLGEIYEYTLMDVCSKIACSRLYSDLQVTHVVKLVAEVALPIAQSLNFETKQLYFIDEWALLKKHQHELLPQIHQLIQNMGFHLELQFLEERQDLEEAQMLRKAYTEKCFHTLQNYLYQGLSLNEIRYHLQSYLRAYNLTIPRLFASDSRSPIAFHTAETNNKMILPIWAYIERDY